MLMTESILKICPSCNKKSKGKKQITLNHGFRKMKYGIVPQSLCRVCRQVHKKKVRHIIKKYPKMGKIDLRTIGKDKQWRSIMNTVTIKDENIPNPQTVKKVVKTNVNKLKKNGTPIKSQWLKLSITERQNWIRENRDIKSIWEKLTIAQQAKYSKGHDEYIRAIDKMDSDKIPVTKRKFLRKTKVISNFKKELIAFQKSTHQKPKGMKKK